MKLLSIVSLSLDPLADIGWTRSELDAVGFVECEEFHRITIDELDIRELDRDDLAFIERGANDVQVSRRNPAADAQHDALLERNAVDSARHARAACARCLAGKPEASRGSVKVQQSRQSRFSVGW